MHGKQHPLFEWNPSAPLHLCVSVFLVGGHSLVLSLFKMHTSIFKLRTTTEAEQKWYIQRAIVYGAVDEVHDGVSEDWGEICFLLLLI